MAERHGQSDQPLRLLTRVRQLYTVFVGLTLLVQLLEWLDADTPVVPHRTVAAGAMVLAAAWAVRLYRDGRPRWWLDLGIMVAMSALGWGLGRNGAILALLIGAIQLRALYGDRWSVAVGTFGIVASFPITTVLIDGADGLLDLGILTVATAAAAVVVVLRLIAEALARHDLVSSWDGALTRVAGDLLASRTLDDIDRAVTRAIRQIHATSTDTAAGLIAPPELPDELPRGETPDDLSATTDRDVRRTLERLMADASLARERLASEQRFRLLAERSLDGIYLRTLARPSTFHYLNPAAEKLLGMTAEELAALRDPVTELVHPEDRSRLDEQMLAEGVVEHPTRFRVKHADHEQWVEIEEVVVDASGDRGPLVQATLRDVTRQWQQEEALRLALEHQKAGAEELRRLDEMKSAFLQAVSHELRTPLATVLGASSTLDERLEHLSREDIGRLIGSVHRQATRLEGLLADLLDVERLSHGLIEPRPRPTPLLALVRNVVAAIHDDHAQVEVVGDEVVAAIEGPKIERVVENLVRNALKHTPEGTTVRVAVEERDGAAVFAVEDDGPGIPSALRRSLFDPFVQGPSASRAASPGTGIGLTLVRRFVELHGGEVAIEDRPGGGARFVVSLPLADDAMAEDPVEA